MCYYVINLIHRISFFFPPFISLAFYSGVRSRGWCHHQYLVHVSISPKNVNWGHCPHPEPFRRCCGALRWSSPPGWRLNSHRDFTCLCPEGNACARYLLSLQGLEVWGWCGLRLSQARDGVVASAGALALIKVAEGMNQGWISLFCPWCYLLPWKVSKLWLHNYDSFPQASVSTI